MLERDNGFQSVVIKNGFLPEQEKITEEYHIRYEKQNTCNLNEVNE